MAAFLRRRIEQSDEECAVDMESKHVQPEVQLSRKKREQPEDEIRAEKLQIQDTPDSEERFSDAESGVIDAPGSQSAIGDAGEAGETTELPPEPSEKGEAEAEARAPGPSEEAVQLPESGTSRLGKQTQKKTILPKTLSAKAKASSQFEVPKGAASKVQAARNRTKTLASSKPVRLSQDGGKDRSAQDESRDRLRPGPSAATSKLQEGQKRPGHGLSPAVDKKKRQEISNCGLSPLVRAVDPSPQGPEDAENQQDVKNLQDNEDSPERSLSKTGSGQQSRPSSPSSGAVSSSAAAMGVSKTVLLDAALAAPIPSSSEEEHRGVEEEQNLCRASQDVQRPSEPGRIKRPSSSSMKATKRAACPSSCGLGKACPSTAKLPPHASRSRQPILHREDRKKHKTQPLQLASIGAGSFGTVYRCQYKGHVLAVKQLHPEKYFDAKKELKILKSAAGEEHSDTSGHPFIVRALAHNLFSDLWACNNSTYFVTMEYMDTNLKELLLRDEGGLDDDEFRVCVFQLLRAFLQLYVVKVVHRDLKPENILIGRDRLRTLKVADFGSAEFEWDIQELRHPVCTEYWRAPEIELLGHHTVSSDWWSCGCVAFDMMNGRPLFASNQGKSLQDMYLERLGRPSVSEFETLRRLRRGTMSSALFSSSSCPSRGPCWSELLPNRDASAIGVSEQLLRYEPEMRPSPDRLLLQTWFQEVAYVKDVLPERLLEFTRIELAAPGLTDEEREQLQSLKLRRKVFEKADPGLASGTCSKSRDTFGHHATPRRSLRRELELGPKIVNPADVPVGAANVPMVTKRVRRDVWTEQEKQLQDDEL